MAESESESERDQARKAEDDEAREDASDEREGASEDDAEASDDASASDDDAEASEDESASASASKDEESEDDADASEDESASEDHERESEDDAESESKSESESEPEASDGASGSDSSATSDDDPPKKASKIWWLLPIAVVVEFWIYGHNGYLDVCVGKEGQTDFALAGAERTDDNRWKFPRCETELNLGLRSEYDDKVAAATKAACRGATLFRNRGESAQCERQEDGWQRQVDARFCPPWDPNYYEHLFWFLK